MICSVFSIFFSNDGSYGVSGWAPSGPSIRNSRSPSPARKRLTASLGSTTPRELPILRTFSCSTGAPFVVITIVATPQRACNPHLEGVNRTCPSGQVRVLTDFVQLVLVLALF